MLPVCGLGSYIDNKEFVVFCSVLITVTQRLVFKNIDIVRRNSGKQVRKKTFISYTRTKKKCPITFTNSFKVFNDITIKSFKKTALWHMETVNAQTSLSIHAV